MVDVESLVQGVTEQQPCGPDLEYDPAFQDLEKAATGRPEQQFGETVIPAEEPAWNEVRESALELLKRTKDLRIATLLTRALVRTESFSGLLPGLELVLTLLERYWDDIHPRLDADDDNDPTMRLNALAPLVDTDGLVRDLRSVSFVHSREHGQLMVRDIEVMSGKLPLRGNAEPVTQRQVEIVLGAVAGEDPVALTRVGQTLATAKALSALLVERIGPERAPDFAPLLSLLARLGQLVRGVLGDAATDGDPRQGEARAQGDTRAQADAGAQGGASGIADAALTVEARSGDPVVEKPMSTEIRTREDALLMLERIVEYFERNEPTNPAPLLLKRARRLVSMNFVDIIKDVAPDSLKQIEAIAGPMNEG